MRIEAARHPGLAYHGRIQDRITGQSFGFDPYATDTTANDEAVAKWRKWHDEQQGGDVNEEEVGTATPE